MTRKWTHAAHLTIALACAGILAAPGALAQQRQGQGAPQQAANQERQKDDQEQEAKKSRTLKVFELEHRQPQEIMQVLSLRSQRAPSLAGQPGAIPGRTTVGFRGAAQQDVSIATDEQKRMLFVRGTEERVNEIEELVNALDAAEDDLEKHQFGDAHLFPVSQQNASRIQAILSQLQLPSQTIQMGKTSLIVVHSSGDKEDHNLQQAEEVINRLNAKEKQSSDDSSDAEQPQDQGGQRRAQEGNQNSDNR